MTWLQIVLAIATSPAAAQLVKIVLDALSQHPEEVEAAVRDLTPAFVPLRHPPA